MNYYYKTSVGMGRKEKGTYSNIVEIYVKVTSVDVKHTSGST